jgi:hypothetical protein
MALENMTGPGKYLNVLDPNWPDGDTDPKQQGDDHIRGMKNVLLNTFGALAASVAAWVGGKDAGGAKVVNVGNGSAASDAVTFGQAPALWNKDAAGAKVVNVANGTAAGDAVNFGQAPALWNKDAAGAKVINLLAGSDPADAVRFDQIAPAIAAGRFVSADLAIAGAGTANHGLGGTPTVVSLMLVCASAQHGYVIGDIVNQDTVITGSNTTGLQAWAGATQVGYSNGTVPQYILPKGGGAGVQITQASWRIRIVASLAA